MEGSRRPLAYISIMKIARDMRNDVEDEVKVETPLPTCKYREKVSTITIIVPAVAASVRSMYAAIAGG